jgi:uncharacterized protein (TIRG00374 family)
VNQIGAVVTSAYTDTEAPTMSASAPKRRGWLRWALVVLIFAACAFFLDLDQVVTTLRRVPIPWLLFILLLWTIDRLLMARKWLVLLKALQVDLPFAKLVRFYYQGTFAGTFLPSGLGGDLLRTYWVSQSTGATPETYASLLMEKMIGLLSAVNWALVGGIVYMFSRLPKTMASWLGVLLIGSLLLDGLFLFSLQTRCHAFVLRCFVGGRRFPLRTFFQRLVEAYSRYGACRGALVWNGLLTIGEHGLQLLIVLLMARSLGIETDAVSFLAVTAIHLLIYRLPISPDGWGVGEVTAIGLYGLIGIAPESGFALALLAHVLQMMVVLPGFWFLWRSGGA